MTRPSLLPLTGLLLLSAACSSATTSPFTDSGGTAGEDAGDSTASAGSAPVASAGTSASAAGSASGGQSGNAGSASGGAAGTLGGAGAGAGVGAADAGGNSGGAAAAGTSSGGASAGGAGGSSCPGAGHITYTLAQSASPTATEQAAYGKIKAAMDKAISYYDCYTNITKSLKVSYVPSVATADGNANGSLRFGMNTTYMDYRTAMHEIGHTVGIGQASNWNSFRTADNLFTGERAAAQLKAINATLSKPLYTEVHADTQHFWPYGINQQSEVKGEADLIAHCQMVVAIREDLGLE